MKYEIRSIKPYKYPNGVIAGGDDEWEADTATKATAFIVAKRVSKKVGVYETIVYEYGKGRDEDFTGQWYFKNGKMTHDMGGNN